ncbi:hypothetical protein, partial [uncultured Thiocystis sp.]|uniref:hypothetical protein n=1 Tax=uncultured Thiocystis sp. TaxID=1202134 RepID=UPI0025D770E3
LGWQFLQKRFKRKIDGLRGVEHGSKKLTHRTSPLIFKGLSAMLALMGVDPRRVGALALLDGESPF